MACRIWKWHENDTYFHHHFYLKNANLTVHYITGTYFFSRWPEWTKWDIVRYVLKLWRAWANWRYQKFINIFCFPTSFGYTQKNLWPTLIYQFEHLGHPMAPKSKWHMLLQMFLDRAVISNLCSFGMWWRVLKLKLFCFSPFSSCRY